MNEDKTELRQRIGELAYKVTQEQGTERPFTSEFAEEWDDGEYHCIVCNAKLFESDHQFNAGCGWPSFDAPEQNTVTEYRDMSHGTVRTEVVCTKCGAHLGHVFPDGPPKTTGLRYCINGVALKFTPEDDAKA